jgi:hypothetical protein
MASTPTHAELIFSILNTVRSRTTITEPITTIIIAFHIKNVRAQLIKQESNKGYTADPNIIQEINCVSLVQVDKGECCEVTGCTIYRTAEKIPSVIELHHKQLITRIGSIDKTQIPFDFVDYAMVPYLGSSKFTTQRPKVFTMNNNGYYYFILPVELEGLEKISIQGVFEDPLEINKFPSCESATCYDVENAPYPIKGWMVPMLTELIVKMFIRPQAAALQDPSNNSKNDLENIVNNQQL